MSIDVIAELQIDRPRGVVAGFAMDANNDPVWIGGISEARWLTEPPVQKGTRAERVASFLGKRIEYVLEVQELEPDARIVMQSVKGPFPMLVTYEFEDRGDSTLARIRIQGDATGFYRLAAPLMGRAVKRNITQDLETLKDLLESGETP